MTEITILNLLNTRPMYGAEMIEEIKRLSGNTVIMSLPTLYSSLHRMATKEYVRSYQKESAIGGRCRVYNITNIGREYLAKNPIKIDYQQIVNHSTTTHKTFSSLEEAFSLPLNKKSSTQPEIPEDKRVLQITPSEPSLTQPASKAVSKSEPKVSPYTPYIAPTEKITATPEPQYHQTSIGLSGTLGGNDLRPLLNLNQVTVGNDYVIINRLRMVAVTLTTAIFLLINFLCSLTQTVCQDYYSLVNIALCIYFLIYLAIYFVYPRIKKVFKRKPYVIRQIIFTVILLAVVITGNILAKTTNFMWLAFFALLPLTEFVLMVILRKRSWFVC